MKIQKIFVLARMDDGVIRQVALDDGGADYVKRLIEAYFELSDRAVPVYEGGQKSVDFQLLK